MQNYKIYRSKENEFYKKVFQTDTDGRVMTNTVSRLDDMTGHCDDIDKVPDDAVLMASVVETERGQTSQYGDWHVTFDVKANPDMTEDEVVKLIQKYLDIPCAKSGTRNGTFFDTRYNIRKREDGVWNYRRIVPTME